MIFFSHFMNLGGALYLKSLEFSLITKNLEMPLNTIINLAIFNLLFLISHYLYTKSYYAKSIKNSVQKIFIKK